MLSIDEILDLFPRHPSSSSSSSSTSSSSNHLLDSLDEDSLSSLLFSLLSSDSFIKLISFISSLFLGSQHSSIQAIKRILKLFLFSLDLIHQKDLSSTQKVQLIEILFDNMRLLSKEQAQSCADKILSNLSSSSSQDILHSNSDISSTLELLPQFVALGGEKCRDYSIERLCRIDWPSNVIVACASALVELNSLHTQDIEVIEKISSYLSLNSTNLINTLPLEDFPSLIYQLTTIASNTAPNNTRLLVLDAVADSLDKIADSNRCNLPGGRNGNGSVRNLTNQVTSTITHHLALLISKDQVFIYLFVIVVDIIIVDVGDFN